MSSVWILGLQVHLLKHASLVDGRWHMSILRAFSRVTYD